MASVIVAAIALFLSANLAEATPSPLRSRDGISLNTTGEVFYNGTCTAETVTTRKEWRSLNDVEKTAYIDAELCLMALPGTTGLPGARDAFSDLQAVHQYWTNTSEGDIIHLVGPFLPFHRYMMYAHGELLRTECNYTGTLPWWDEALDAASGDFFQSSMWDDDTGFGGNGTGSDKCVTSGPFANRTMHIGPAKATTDYCFQRDWNNTWIVAGGQDSVAECYAHNEYLSFYGCLADKPHRAGHWGTGGEMSDISASPGDPVFYLHHNYVDRLWWQWQQINSTSRLYDMSGYTTQIEPVTGWVNTTLDYTLSVYDIIPDIAVKEVMNIQGGYLCYEYSY